MTCYLKSIREKTQLTKQETNLALKTFIKYLLGIFLPEIPVDFGSFKWSESKTETLLRGQNRRPGLIQSSSHFMYISLDHFCSITQQSKIFVHLYMNFHNMTIKGKSQDSQSDSFSLMSQFVKSSSVLRIILLFNMQSVFVTPLLKPSNRFSPCLEYILNLCKALCDLAFAPHSSYNIPFCSIQLYVCYLKTSFPCLGVRQTAVPGVPCLQVFT